MRTIFKSHADFKFLLSLLQGGVEQHSEKRDPSKDHDPAQLCQFLGHFLKWTLRDQILVFRRGRSALQLLLEILLKSRW